MKIKCFYVLTILIILPQTAIMPIKIEISNKYLDDLISFYLEKQKEIKLQIHALENELTELSSLIINLKQSERLESNMQSDTKEYEQYSTDWTWVKKISFVLEKAKKPLSTREIVDVLEVFEPQYVLQRKTATASVSATLSTKSGSYLQKKEFIKIPSEWGDSKFELWTEKENEFKLPPKVDDDFPF